MASISANTKARVGEAKEGEAEDEPPQVHAGSLDDESGEEGDDVERAVFSEEEEEEEVRCAAEYKALCAQHGTARCSKWLRACAAESTQCSLGHYGLGTHGAAPLALSLKWNERVQHLDLSDNGLGADGVCSVLDALTQGGAPELRSLSLRRNQAGVEGAEGAAALLCARPAHPLERLDLTANAIGDRGASAVARGLARNASLLSLILGDNEIDAEGAEQLASALKVNSRLAELSLEWNNIRAEGGRAVAEALQGQRSLHTLNLGWNGLMDEGVAAVAAALRPAKGSEGESPCALSDLRLHQNRMTAQGSGALACVIKHLDSLDVSGNPLGSEGASALLLALQSAQSPCKLVANDVCVRPETKIHTLLCRAGRREAIELHSLQAAGVESMAAASLVAGVEAINLAQKKPSKKNATGKAPSLLKENSSGLGSQRKLTKEESANWRRTDRCPEGVERKPSQMRL
ncbi:hypothetical protein AB1Y20_004219 [Prymnesium parvum]|uniref:Uncharacterized protein n=1 Tax=Prymnesium parvum TaxID=97485 RepID=A0AB34J6Z8_PRYPA